MEDADKNSESLASTGFPVPIPAAHTHNVPLFG